MTGTQYKNVAQWTLANGAAEASDSAAAAKAIFDNMGVPFPAGSCGEILLTLMSEDYMGWRACTHLEAQEYANAGTAAVGIDGEHVVVILPEEGEDLVGAVVQANATSYARQASDISTAERITMQFYANMNQSTVDWYCTYYGNLVINKAESMLGKGYNDFTEAIRDGIKFNANAWCVDFVRWCFKKAGVYESDIIPELSSTTYMRNWYRDTDGQKTNLYSGYSGIRRGDIVFVGELDSPSSLRHTCIATSVASGGGKVDTINGNWGNKVAEQTFPTSNRVISFYARPHYERVAD